MFQDLRLGLRMLLKNPGFTAVVVLTLALGIGANVALFSVVNGVLLNPLPFPQPDQLVTLDQSKPNFDMGAIPYPNFRDLQKENQTFSAMAISRGFGFSLIGAGEAERVSARLVSADFFSVLGVKPALGRTFAPGEDEPGVGAGGRDQRRPLAAQVWRGAGCRREGSDAGRQELHDCRRAPRETSALFRTTDVYVPIGQWNNPALKSPWRRLWDFTELAGSSLASLSSRRRPT